MTCSTAVCFVLTVLVLYNHEVPASEVARLLGLWPVSLMDTARTMLLVAILFAGPLFENGIVDGELKDWLRLKGVYESLSSWTGYRNYVVVGYTFAESDCAQLMQERPL